MLESPIRSAMRSPLQQALDRIGSAPAVWTPAALFAASEQGVWYDPSDFSTLFQDAAGTVPVTATGQPVGRILDKSGRGNHATQATTASKPILQQDANGKYYLAFDGVDDSMATAAVNFTATDKMSVFAGAYWTSGTGVVAELSSSGANPGCFYVVAGADRVTGWNSISTGSAAANTLHTGYVTASAPDLAVVTATHDISGDLSRVRRNGVAGVDGTLDKGAGNYTNNILYIGRRDSVSLPLNGRIYQLIIRGALTDAAGIAAAETFVNSKTGAY